jgi:hypothetical protein
LRAIRSISRQSTQTFRNRFAFEFVITSRNNINDILCGEHMPKLKVLVDWALKNSGDAERYHRRITTNPTLANLGCLPQKISEISNNEPPWFCHGLAFRMATYSDGSDYLFDRWETLLRLAQQANGWPNEYMNWSSDANHWAKKHDRFHQFLWLLQCYEYFSQLGHRVSFPASGNSEAMPDLSVKRQGQEQELYVECYFYSKWWPREEFLQELLRKIDENLWIERKHNIAYNSAGNPFSDDQLVNTLDHLLKELTQEKLSKLRVEACEISPQKVCDIGKFWIELRGEGEYQPDVDNSHGDASYSLPVYLKEIIMAKMNSNNLMNSRPNMVMANATGIDFQFSFPQNLDQLPTIKEIPISLDEVWISICGIDGNLATCQQVLKIWRNGYTGWCC